MRLIDAYPVQEMLLGARDEVAHWTDKKICELFLRLIVEQPTVDAAPVIRCQNCKYYNLQALACFRPNFNGWIGMNGFCSYGERKSDG